MSLTTDLVAYYKCDETSGSNLTDAHSGGLNLTQVNTVGAGTGKLNGARDLEAGSLHHFSIADSSPFVIGDEDCYFCGWMQLESGTGTILAKFADAGGKEYFLGVFQISAGNFRLRLLASGNGSTHTTVTADGFGALSLATWYFFEGWHDATNNLIGVSVNRTENTAAHTTGISGAATQPFYIGRYVNGFYWDGLLDEIYIRIGSLPTTDERNTLYGSGTPPGYDSFAGGGGTVVPVRTLMGVGV